MRSAVCNELAGMAADACTQSSALLETQAPGKEDIVWIVKAQPRPEDMEDLGALAEWGAEPVLLGFWHCSLHTGLCAIPCEQRYAL